MSDILTELEKIELLAQTGGGFGYTEEIGEDLIYGYSKAEEVANPAGLTYGLRIVNTGETGSEEVDLFGYRGSVYTNNRITITAQSGYGDYRMFCLHNGLNPSQLVAVRITSTQTQIDGMSLAWHRETVFGERDSKVISVASYRTEQDYQTGIITIPLSIVLAFDTFVRTSVLAMTTVDLLLFFGVRRDIAKPVYKAQETPKIPGKTGTQPIRPVRPVRPVTALDVGV
jgi:hypothetical protein